MRGPMNRLHPKLAMNRLLLKVAMTAMVGSLLLSNPTLAQMHRPAAQILPPAKKAAHVQITKGPALEFAADDLAIVRWTTNNPGGSDEHFGVVHYGTDPKYMTDTAKSHIRLNRGHPETIFRVRMPGLKPQMTYYYWVSSIESNGKSDGEKSGVNQFTMPDPGKRIVVDSP
jgi:hypothetical protein